MAYPELFERGAVQIAGDERTLVVAGRCTKLGDASQARGEPVASFSQALVECDGAAFCI